MFRLTVLCLTRALSVFKGEIFPVIGRLMCNCHTEQYAWEGLCFLPLSAFFRIFFSLLNSHTQTDTLTYMMAREIREESENYVKLYLILLCMLSRE